eukprot:1729891-Alexandrium_andersonii.AAC.1
MAATGSGSGADLAGTWRGLCRHGARLSRNSNNACSKTRSALWCQTQQAGRQGGDPTGTAAQ